MKNFSCKIFWKWKIYVNLYFPEISTEISYTHSRTVWQWLEVQGGADAMDPSNICFGGPHVINMWVNFTLNDKQTGAQNDVSNILNSS